MFAFEMEPHTVERARTSTAQHVDSFYVLEGELEVTLAADAAAPRGQLAPPPAACTRSRTRARACASSTSTRRGCASTSTSGAWTTERTTRSGRLRLVHPDRLRHRAG